MNSQQINRALRKGITPFDPRFPGELERQKSEDLRHSEMRKGNCVRGFEKVLFLGGAGEISRWLHEQPWVRLGALEVVEVWARGDERLLAVKDRREWRVFRVSESEARFRILARVL